jgi:addiction module HigA family antidote
MESGRFLVALAATDPFGVRIAREIGVPPHRINEIVHGKRSVTADTALRLARYFGTFKAFWMGLQAYFDLEEARHRLGKRLEAEGSVHAV